MERIKITIHPPSIRPEGLLGISDAMQQVIDYIKLLREAGQFVSSPGSDFDWKLERASTNSPLSIWGVAESIDPAKDITEQAHKAKETFVSGMRHLIDENEIAPWMGADAIKLAHSIFSRTLDGIGSTEIEIAANDSLIIDHEKANIGIKIISGISALVEEDELAERTAFGEIEGLMVSAGRYKNSPAIQINNDMYGYIWCYLSKKLTEQFGTEHKMRDIWEGKTLGIQGKLNYARGGKLKTIQAVNIREIPEVPLIDLESVLDPDFTSGLAPSEYLRRFNNGELV